MLKKHVPKLAVVLARMYGEIALQLVDVMEHLLTGKMAEVVTDFEPELWASYYRQLRTFGKAIWLRERKTAGPLRELAIFSRYLRRLARQISRGSITAEDLQNELNDFSQQPEQWHEL